MVTLWFFGHWSMLRIVDSRVASSPFYCVSFGRIAFLTVHTSGPIGRNLVENERFHVPSIATWSIEHLKVQGTEYIFWIYHTLPETNSFAPEDRPSQKETIVFPSIHFSGAKMLVFREGNLNKKKLPPSDSSKAKSFIKPKLSDLYGPGSKIWVPGLGTTTI